jgi:GTP-binding protein
MIFTITIVGRPNVGKSTLFNRLAGKKLALVDHIPGLTRDRREAMIRVGGHEAMIMDTAGLEDADAGSVQERMRQQTDIAINCSDLVLFMIDARAGVVSADEEFASLVRENSRPVVLVANKCEGRAAEAGLYDSYRLGLGDPAPISAEHGEGIGDLLDMITEHIAAADGRDDESRANNEADEAEKPIRIAVIGRPNAGKSTLVNALLGEERMITGPEAGLTRDAVALSLDWRTGDVSRQLRIFDTAGLRRKAKIRQKAEQLSVNDSLRAVRFAEVVILLLDSERALEKQDLAIADLVEREGRALVIAINKWDLVKDKSAKLAEINAEVSRLLPQLKGVPVVTISAHEKQGLGRLMKEVFVIYDAWNVRISTARLNKFILDATTRHTPPAAGGRRIKLRYMTQPNSRPPTFIVFCSRPGDLPKSYSRYLVNALRESFKLAGTPIRLILRKGNNPYV